MSCRMMLGLLGGAMLLAIGCDLWADAKDNPYWGIVTRNAFNLRPPPDPSTNQPNQPPPPPSNVRLTGVYRFSGVKKAVLEITDPQNKGKVDRPPPMTEGDVQGPVTVVAIDVEGGKVQIKNGTDLTWLDFEQAAKQPGPAPAGAPQPVPFPGAVPGQPFPRPAIPGLPTPAGATAAVPGSTAPGGGNVLVGGAQPMGTAPNAAATASPFATYTAATPGASVIPPRPVRTGTEGSSANVVVGGAGGTTPQPAASREDAWRRMLEMQEAIKRAQAQNPNVQVPPAPTMPPVPNFPTRYR